MRATIRPYEPGDLSAILQLWEHAGCVPVGHDGLTLDQAVELMTSNPGSTLVAELDGETVGVAIAGVVAAVGWIYRLTLSAGLEDGVVAGQLLDALERRLAEAGARKVVTVVED